MRFRLRSPPWAAALDRQADRVSLGASRDEVAPQKFLPPAGSKRDSAEGTMGWVNTVDIGVVGPGIYGAVPAISTLPSSTGCGSLKTTLSPVRDISSTWLFSPAFTGTLIVTF